MIHLKKNRIYKGTKQFLVLALFIVGAIDSAAASDVVIEGKVLTLEECIQIGLKTNPARDIAVQNYNIAGEKIGEARGPYYPVFKLSASYENKPPPPMTLTGLYDERVTVKQLLFDAGATSYSLENAKHNMEAQKHDVKRAELDIVLSITTAFYEILKRQDITAVTKAALKTAEIHVEQTKTLYQQGLAPRSDVLKMEVQLSNAKLDVIKAAGDLLLAKATLSAALGLSATTDFEVRESKMRGDKDALPLIEDLKNIAYGQRPELRVSSEKIAASTAAIDQVKRSKYPNLSFEASYGYQKRVDFTKEEKWSVGLNLTLPVFEQLIAQSKLNQAVAGKEALSAIDVQLRRSIELEIYQSWLGLKNGIEKMQVTKITLDQAMQDMHTSEGRYKEGTGNIVEIMDSQTVVTQAAINNVIALYDVANARARLNRAVGNQMGYGQ